MHPDAPGSYSIITITVEPVDEDKAVLSGREDTLRSPPFFQRDGAGILALIKPAEVEVLRWTSRRRSNHVFGLA
jgi:hypothetical protein